LAGVRFSFGSLNILFGPNYTGKNWRISAPVLIMPKNGTIIFYYPTLRRATDGKQWDYPVARTWAGILVKVPV
jgi:hypothetical protein